MNSALQILLHTDKLIEKILDFKNPFIDNITKNFIDLIKDLVINYYKQENDYIIKSFSPTKFRNKYLLLCILILILVNKIQLNLSEYS